MNSQHLTISLFILIVTGVGEGLSNNQTEFYGTCNRSFSCGDIPGFRYPFRRGQDPAYCGYPGFELNCEEESPPTINTMNLTYHVLGIDPTGQILKIVREDMTNLACPQNLVNTTIDYDLFSYTSNYRNISLLYGCPSSFKMPVIGAIFCENNGGIPVFLVPGIQSPESCKSSIVMPFPVGFMEPTDESGLVLQQGFEVRWKVEAGPCNACTQSGGDCLYNNDTLLTTCACREAPFLADSCSTTRVSSPSDIPKSSKKASLSIILPTIGAIIVAVGIGMGIFVCRQRKKRRMIKVAAAQSNVSSKGLTSDTQSNFTSSTPSNPSSKVNKEYGKCSYFGAQVFTYEELEVATDNFNDSRELGDGGYGTVYHGKLLDGREVAVKRLYDNNFKRVEQFMNEVEILTRLSHKNLLKLYGCTSKRSRELLLVYEYIPNGTVADHLHGKLANSNSKSCLFTWSVRLKIAIETAEALTYLHESDIIHRDVKTNNILLDESFRVKVADFGLSRLFPNNCTHVSTAPQGTPGYVDPEYYLCYQLTDKSDVYSFGVVLVELISSLHAVDTNRDRLDINLAAMAINKITTHMLDELVDKSIGFETNDSVRRMITLVAELAFRCLQEKTDMRPTMKEVLEVLRGIQNDEMNAQKPEVLDILVDDGALFKDHCTEPSSPDYGVTNTLYGRSMPNSSDG